MAVELDFRDETKTVPDHIALWMSGIDTARLTYEEAIAEMNQKQQRDLLNQYAAKFVNDHFREDR